MHTKSATKVHGIDPCLYASGRQKILREIILIADREFRLHPHTSSPPAHHGASCPVAGGAAAPSCKSRYFVKNVRSLTEFSSSASMPRLSPTSPPRTSRVTGLESRMDGRWINLRGYVQDINIACERLRNFLANPGNYRTSKSNTTAMIRTRPRSR